MLLRMIRVMAPHPRKATIDDIDGIAAMAGELFSAHVGYDARRFFVPDDAGELYRNWFMRPGAAEKLLFLVSEREDRSLCAYAIAEAYAAEPEFSSPEHVYIHDVYVAPELRHTGLAEQLIEDIAAWVKGRGITQLRAMIALDNARSLAFFTKRGFRATVTEVTRDLR
jgi:L-amino acid N-acyltransferase YncA